MNKCGILLSTSFYLLIGTATAAFCQKTFVRSFPAKPGGALIVDSDFGDLTIRGTSLNEVRITVQMDKEIQDIIRPTVTTDGVFFCIRTEGKRKYRLNRYLSDKTRTVVTVPDNFNLHLKSRHGDIDILDISGQVVSRTTRGSIRMENISGDLKAGASRGGIRLSRIAARVEASTTGGAIQVTELSGKVSAHSGGGEISLDFNSRPEGDCLIQTGGCSIRLRLPRALPTYLISRNTNNERCLENVQVRPQGENSGETLTEGLTRLILTSNGGTISIAYKD